jgi:hypothetical protein
MGFEKWDQMLMRKNIQSPLRTQHQHNMPRGFLRRRRLVSHTDRFVGGTRWLISELGLVSRVSPVHTAVRNCTRDEEGSSRSDSGVDLKASACHALADSNDLPVRELAIKKAHGPTSRRKAIATIRSASALISTAPATGSRSSSIGSSNAVGSRRATTSLPRITSPSSNLRQ